MILKNFGINASVDELISQMNEYAALEYAYNIHAKGGVRETLEGFRFEGYGLSVLTASPHSMLEVCLISTGLA